MLPSLAPAAAVKNTQKQQRTNGPAATSAGPSFSFGPPGSGPGPTTASGLSSSLSGVSPAVSATAAPAITTTATTVSSSTSSSTSCSSPFPPPPALSASTTTTPSSTPKKTVRFHADTEEHGRRIKAPGGSHSRKDHGSSAAFSGSINSISSTTNTANTNAATADDDDDPVVRSTLLQPRVAVVLGVPRLWHLPLFACRLVSISPAIWWSLGILLRLLVQLHALAGGGSNGGSGGLGDVAGARAGDSSSGSGNSANLFLKHERTGLSLESRLKLTEIFLAMVWATIVRLLAVSALNGYATSWVIYLAGSGGDSRLLLPAWIAIAAILTALYHLTQRKINIRKETSISIGVFSGASFISMCALLAQLYWDRPEYADVPVVALARRVLSETTRVAGNLFDIGNITMDL